MSDICGVTSEVPHFLTGAPLVYRCEREPGHGGTVHEGHCTNSDGGYAQWPMSEPAVAP